MPDEDQQITRVTAAGTRVNCVNRCTRDVMMARNSRKRLLKYTEKTNVSGCRTTTAVYTAISLRRNALIIFIVLSVQHGRFEPSRLAARNIQLFRANRSNARRIPFSSSTLAILEFLVTG